MDGPLEEIELGDVTVVSVWSAQAFAAHYGIPVETVVEPFVLVCGAHSNYMGVASRAAADEACGRAWCTGCQQVVKERLAAAELRVQQEEAHQAQQVAEAALAGAQAAIVMAPPAATSGTYVDAPPQPAASAVTLPAVATPAPAATNGAAAQIWAEAFALKDKVEALEGQLAGTRELLSQKLAELSAEDRLAPCVRGTIPYAVRARGEKFFIQALKGAKKPAASP